MARAIVKLPVLADLRLSLKRDDDRTYHFPDVFETWSTLFLACRSSSICVFDVTLLPINFAQRGLVISHGNCDGDGDGDGDGGSQNFEDAQAIPRRWTFLPRLTRLKFPLAKHGTKAENIKILEQCPNLQTLYLSHLNTADCRHDLARIVATCCPLLDAISFRQYIATITDSMVPYELMSMLKEQQVKGIDLSSSRHPLQSPEAVGIVQETFKDSSKIRYWDVLFR